MNKQFIAKIIILALIISLVCVGCIYIQKDHLSKKVIDIFDETKDLQFGSGREAVKNKLSAYGFPEEKENLLIYDMHGKTYKKDALLQVLIFEFSDEQQLSGVTYLLSCKNDICSEEIYDEIKSTIIGAYGDPIEDPYLWYYDHYTDVDEAEMKRLKEEHHKMETWIDEKYEINIDKMFNEVMVQHQLIKERSFYSEDSKTNV